MIASLHTLETQCPALINSFLLLKKQDLKEDEHKEKKNIIQEDALHRNVLLSLRGFRLERANYYNIRASIKLANLNIPHPFLTHLNQAYFLNYRLRNVMDFGIKSLKWYGRVRYTGQDNKRYVYRLQDSIVAREVTREAVVSREKLKIKIIQVFTHVYRGKRYVFLIVQKLKRKENVVSELISNPVMDLEVFNLARRFTIIGLPAVHDIQLYFVSISRGIATEIEDDDDDLN